LVIFKFKQDLILVFGTCKTGYCY